MPRRLAPRCSPQRHRGLIHRPRIRRLSIRQPPTLHQQHRHRSTNPRRHNQVQPNPRIRPRARPHPHPRRHQSRPPQAAGPPPPGGTVGAQAAASSGATELAGQGTFAAAAALPAEESTDATEFTTSVGGIMSTGNARSAAATGGATLRLRRGIHQFGSAVAGNYASAGVEGEDGFEQTVGNVQGRVRYDIFFAKRWSGFLMTTARHDPFQGLDVRFNVDPGVAFYLLNKAKHRMWFEAGYDFQYDVRTEKGIRAQEDGDGVMMGDIIAKKTEVNHAARLFAGYENRLHEQVVFITGVEYLQSLIRGPRFRLNWDTALATQLFNRFSLAFTFTLRYEKRTAPEY